MPPLIVYTTTLYTRCKLYKRSTTKTLSVGLAYPLSKTKKQYATPLYSVDVTLSATIDSLKTHTDNMIFIKTCHPLAIPINAISSAAFAAIDYEKRYAATSYSLSVKLSAAIGFEKRYRVDAGLRHSGFVRSVGQSKNNLQCDCVRKLLFLLYFYNDVG